ASGRAPSWTAPVRAGEGLLGPAFRGRRLPLRLPFPRREDVLGRRAGSQSSGHEADDQGSGRSDVEGKDRVVNLIAGRYPAGQQGQEETGDPESDLLVARRKMDGTQVVETEQRQDLYGGASHEAPEESVQRLHSSIVPF